MEYKTFQNRVRALINKAGGGISASFTEDTDKGLFRATCSDGTTIIGNASSLKVTVRYGSGHQAMAVI